MAEFIKLQTEKVISKKNRANLIILTYLTNFNLFIYLFLKYNNIFVKGLLILIINGYFIKTLRNEPSISSMNSWAIVFAIIGFIFFGWSSWIFFFNLIVIIINLIYLKYIIKNLDLSQKEN